MDELNLLTAAGTVYARAAGDAAAPLILGLHGWSKRNGWHTWAPLMEPLAAAGFRVVSVDMPGWGQSPALGGAPLSEEQGESVVLALLDELQPAAPAVLMGKSWGGALALNTALDHPQRVSKLVLTAPAFGHFERLPGLTQPVLLAWAEDDPVIPVAFAARYQETVPHLSLVTYPTGGHSAAPENAADFAPCAIAFLNGGS